MDGQRDQQHLLELLVAGQPEDLTDVDVSTVRYALYARKSTTSEDRQASSIEDQIKDCTDRVITPNGITKVKLYKESRSAKISDSRIEFNKMIQDIEAGRIDGVIAWHPDRLSRNMKDAGAIIDLVDRGSIRDLKFSTFSFENTPAGKMLLGITFVIAKQYSEHLSESVGRGNRRATEDGEYIGKFKHGYFVDENRHLQRDSANFVKVQRMFEMIVEGASQKDVREWVNTQNYKVSKRKGLKPVAHTWSKDDVSEVLKDPVYAGVLKYGKNLINLVKSYGFVPAVSVEDFLKINKVDSFNSAKITSFNRPKASVRNADLLRGMVYCERCDQTLTSMMLPKNDKITKKLSHYRYYYKCETVGCPMTGKSAKAILVVDEAQKFFNEYLFTTKSNYEVYIQSAKENMRRKTSELRTSIAQYKADLINKNKSYEQTKLLLLKTPSLNEHYNLDKLKEELDEMKTRLEQLQRTQNDMKNSLPEFEEYLKLLESTPEILGKIRDMKVMDALLRIFFSNFTIIPKTDGKFKGSEVSYELKEPWKGFVESGDFVCGAG